MTNKKLLTKKFKYSNKPTYIKSIEASAIYEHTMRGTELKKNNYAGMIPFSLELIQLREAGMIQFREKTEKNIVNGKTEYKNVAIQIEPNNRAKVNKYLSDDIINVKFTNVVYDAKEIIERSQKGYEESIQTIINSKVLNDKQKQYEIIRLKKESESRTKEIKAIANKNSDVWENKVSLDELRQKIYEDGFTLIDFKGDPIKYVRYKRSSAKSRKGECLFIKEALYKDMIKWSRMNLDIKEADDKYEGDNVDLAGLLSYEALVGSTLVDLIQIPTENILLVDDVDSKFKVKATVVKKGINKRGGNLVAEVDGNFEMKNSLFDGQSLLDSSFYPKGKSMMLLRNVFFKSCAFSCNIKSFLEDKKPKEYKSLDDWYINDMFGTPIQASKIKFVITPNSLKALKFSDLVGTGKEMYEHWKDFIEVYKGGSYFGIVKYEKETKRGFNKEGMPLQRLSYQMVNSLPLQSEEIEALCEFEKNYIMDLKNNADVYCEYLLNTANDLNTNEVYAGLYKHNPKIAQTPFFKDLRKNKIANYIKEVKGGRVRVVGDYCVLFGNGIEMLYHAIGQLVVEGKEVKSLSLQGNEVYTPLFGEIDLTGFRNPHTSASNIYHCKNTHNEDLKKYFNLSNNIICVNSIENPILSILSGSDFDGDTLLLSSDEILVNTKGKAKEFLVCENKINEDKIPYTLSNYNCYEVDKSLANSYIGKIVNLGQLAQSIYWNAVNSSYKGKVNKIAENMKEVIDIVAVLSGVAIDMAKRKYDIELDVEIRSLEKRVNECKKAIEIGESDKKRMIKIKPSFLGHLQRKQKTKESTKSNNAKNYKKTSSYKKLNNLSEEEIDYVLNDDNNLIYLVLLDKQKENKSDVDVEIKHANYNTPMDYLFNAFKLDVADTEKTENILTLISKTDANGKKYLVDEANDKQEKELIQMVNETVSSINTVQARADYKDNEDEFRVITLDAVDSLTRKVAKRKVDAVTMYAILYHMFDKKTINFNGRLLNVLYKTQTETFLNAFVPEGN